MKTVTCEDFRKEWLDAAEKEAFLNASEPVREHWQRCVECQQEWFWWQEYRPYVYQVFEDEKQAMSHCTVAHQVMSRINGAGRRAFLPGLFGGIKSMRRLGLLFSAAFMLIFVFIFTQSVFVPEGASQHQLLQAFAGQQLTLGGFQEGGIYAIDKRSMVASIGEPLTLIGSSTKASNGGLALSLIGIFLVTLWTSWLTRKWEH